MANVSANKKTTSKTEKATVGTSAVVNSTVEAVTETKVKPLKDLKDTDEIMLVSQIPNVSYKDVKNNDFYEWNEVGHEEAMTYQSIKDMYRNYRTYFKDMWLKPMDERIVKQFGLESDYRNYEYLLDKTTYTRNNMTDISEKIGSLPKGIKSTLINKIKSFV